MVDRQFWELENGGSIPLTPTTLGDEEESNPLVLQTR